MPRDWDKTLSYETIKMVRIEDKILGGLHWGLTFLIAVYVGLYVFLIQKGYLKYEDITGIVRLSIQSPPKFDLSSAMYCTNAGPTQPASNPKPCEVWSKYSLSATEDLTNSFFLATHVEYQTMTRNCSGYYDELVQYRACSVDWATIATEQSYVAEVGKFIVTVAHNAFAPEHAKDEPRDEFYFKGNSVDMEGTFVTSNSDAVVQPSGVADSFLIRSLLMNVSNVPAIDLDTRCLDHTCASSNRTFREVGVVLVINLDYDNDYGIFSPSLMRYKISVSRMLDTFFSVSTLENVVGGAEQSRTVKTIRGIRLDFIQSGQIGKPDFATILTVAFESVVLLKVAALLVDLVATKLLKNRHAYSTMKYARMDRTQVKLRKQKLKGDEPLASSLLSESMAE